MNEWYETWSVTISEERRLTVIENRVLKRIFRPKSEVVTGGWRKFDILRKIMICATNQILLG
jgi:flagellar motor switch protein FliM